MKTDHDKRKVSINSHLAKLQNQQDKRQDSNKQQEQQFASNQGDMRKRVGISTFTHLNVLSAWNINDCLHNPPFFKHKILVN